MSHSPTRTWLLGGHARNVWIQEIACHRNAPFAQRFSVVVTGRLIPVLCGGRLKSASPESVMRMFTSRSSSSDNFTKEYNLKQTYSLHIPKNNSGFQRA